MDFGTSIFHNTQHETTLHFLKLELHFLWCKCYVAFIRTFLWFANYITHTASIQHDKARCSWPESKIREMGGGGEWKQWTCLCKTCTYYLVWGGGGAWLLWKGKLPKCVRTQKEHTKNLPGFPGNFPQKTQCWVMVDCCTLSTRRLVVLHHTDPVMCLVQDISTCLTAPEEKASLVHDGTVPPLAVPWRQPWQ